MLRRLCDQTLRRLGIEPIPKWGVSSHAHDFVHAEALRELFEAKEVDCVFDVGAFNGHFGRFLRDKAHFRGTILSFEPQPAPYQVLKEWSDRDDGWHAFQIALGANPGDFQMNMMDKLWFSSFMDPSAATPRNLAGRNRIVSTFTATVETIARLYDDLATRHGFARPFLKMDTQGFDVNVMRGAGGKIGQFVGMQSELGFIPIYNGMPDWHEALAEYERAGFAISAFFPVSTDEALRAVELDVVMVRR